MRFTTYRDWHWFVGGAGKVLIALGVLMFGFVGYQLWGTGIETELAQRRLEDDFDEMLAAAVERPTNPSTSRGPDNTSPPTGISPGETVKPPGAINETNSVTADPSDIETEVPQMAAPPSTAVPVAEQRIPELDDGSALARLEIPAIGVNDIVVAGIGVSELKKGPGHFPDTPLPGQLGNAAIAGHRTTYGAPFFDVDRLVVGDEVIMTTLEGRYIYEVSDQTIVDPSAYEVVATSDPTLASLTLVSCEPKWTARNRIIVTAVLNVERSDAVGEALLHHEEPSASAAGPPPSEADSATGSSSTANAPDLPVSPSEAEVSGTSGASGSLLETPPANPAPVAPDSGLVEGLSEAFGQGWFSDPAANGHVGAWGALLAGVSLGACWVSRRSGRNLVGAAVGIGPFVVVLYFFYQNVNRLLPPGL